MAGLASEISAALGLVAVEVILRSHLHDFALSGP